MTRQFSGLPISRQLWWANKYVRRFGGRVDLGRSPIDPPRVVNMRRPEDRMTAEALREMDETCHAEWRNR